MLTKHPHIVYSLPPKRSGKKRERVEHSNLPTTVQALTPQHFERKQRAAALAAKTARVVDPRTPSPFDEIDHEQARKVGSDQPAPERDKNGRAKSGQ
jgi:hypothetical protein